MPMIGKLYCRLVEYGFGYRHDMEDEDTINSRLGNSPRFITIRNENGRIRVTLPDGASRLIINDQSAVETIIGLVDDVERGT